MFFNRYLKPAVFLFLTLAVLNWLAMANDYYYTTNWYDFMMHFLGGLSVVLLLLWFINTGDNKFFTFLKRPMVLLLLVLVIGALWEYFEYFFNLVDIHDKGYVWDTTHDLIMDVVGGAAGILLSLHKKK